LYRNGILKRAEFIFSSYCLSKIVFSKNDVVLDCGANYGDMYLKLSNLINPINYIGIEPSPSAFKALKINVATESKLINKALGNINGNLSFFLSEDEGDSSLIEPKKFSQIITVPVIRLEELIKKLNIDKIKLLKIEVLIKVIDKPAQSNKKWNSHKPDPASSKSPWCIYNVGNNKPIKLLYYLKSLEKIIKKKQTQDFFLYS